VTESEASRVVEKLIHGDGYALVESLIDSETAARVRARVLEEVQQQQSRTSAQQVDSGVIGLGQAVQWGPDFEALVTNPGLLSIARKLLGDDVALGDMAAKVLMPGCEPGGLHVDYPYWAMDPGLPVEPALMMQVIWMMEPFTAENGGTWIAPGSQRWTEPLDRDRFRKHASQAMGKAGDAVVSHGMLWHQTAENHSTEPRVAILINYTQIAIRPMRDAGPFTEAFKARATPELRSLLGFDHSKAIIKRAMANRVK